MKMSKEKNTGDETEVAETLDKRVTRLEAMLRKIIKVAEVHWGKDYNLDGKIGMWLAIMLFSLLAMPSFADTRWDIIPTDELTATCRVDITRGSMATLVVDRVECRTLVSTTSTNITGNISAKNIAVTAGGGFKDAATSTNSLIGVTTVSNAADVVYAKHLMATAGGGFRDVATSTNTLIGVTTVSNAAAIVYAKTVTVVAGGGIKDAATSTNTFIGKFTLDGTQGTAGTVASHTTNAPTSTSVAPEWIPIVHNGSNYWIAAWYQGS